MAMIDAITGRVVLIVGGTRGLGLSAARRLVAVGARVVVTGKEAEEVMAAQALLGETARGVVADATCAGSAEAAVALAVAAFGRALSCRWRQWAARG
jgi:NAD(P)-dependent dehydrogenase (short-subunit alcohol dehydrogenase family)